MVTFFFLLSSIFILKTQGIADIEKQVYYDTQNIEVAVEKFGSSMPRQNRLQNIFTNMMEQKKLIIRRDLRLRFDMPKQFVEDSLELADHRIDGFEREYDKESFHFFVTKDQAYRDQALYEYLLEHNMSVETDGMNSAFYLSFTLNMLGFAAFFIILLLSSNILTEDADHESLTASYPILFEKKITVKLLIYVLYSFLMLAGSLGLSTLLISLWKETGDFNYPAILFTKDGFQGVPVYQYAGIFLVYLFLLSIQVVLLAAFLNKVTKNTYLTLFIGSLAYFMPVILPSLSSVLFFLPVNFYNMSSILEGKLAGTVGQTLFNYKTGIFILFLWTLAFFAGIGWYARSQKRSLDKERKEVTV